MVMEVCRFWPTEADGTTIGRMRGDTAETTETLPMAAAMFGALAVITAEPGATPVTGVITTLAMPAGKVTEPGTVTAAGLLLLSVIAKPPAGACPPVSLRVRVP